MKQIIVLNAGGTGLALKNLAPVGKNANTTPILATKSSPKATGAHSY